MERRGHLEYGGRRLCVLVSVAVMALSHAPCTNAVVITQHPIPAPARNLVGWPGGLLATGITPNVLADAITSAPFAVGKSYGNANNVAAVGVGPNGLPWIVAAAQGSSGLGLYEVTATSVTQRVVLPEGASVFALATGPDRDVWMASGNKILRYQPGAGVTSYLINGLPRQVDAVDIAAGPDDAVWFTDLYGAIGRINVINGGITMYPIEDGDNQFGWGYMGPYGIAAGPDGALWFTEQNHERIGRITVGGQIQEFQIPYSKVSPGVARYPQPRFIVSGPESSMWYSDPGDDSVGRVTVAGEVTEYTIPSTGNSPEVVPDEITIGPEGDPWFNEDNAKDLGSVGLGAPVASPAPAKKASAASDRRAHTASCQRRVRKRATKHTRCAKKLTLSKRRSRRMNAG